MQIRKLITDYWLLIIMLLIAAFLRFYKLGEIPPHLYSDEAALGYNAYSISKTGRDEYGNLLPIIFKSFGDYKPGLYVYLTVPFVAIFGLTEFAVRLPSAISGVVAIYLLYLLIGKLSNSLKIENCKLKIVASFLLAISPWHIYFSRGAWEVNVALTLTLAGVYFFYKALDKQSYLVFSAAFFGLTLLTYQGAKLSTLIVVVILGALYHKKVIAFTKRVLFASVLLSVIVAAPTITSFFSEATGRLGVFNIFSYKREEEVLRQFLNQGLERIGDLSYYLFHSEFLNFARGVLGRYFNHFSAKFLFFEGDWQNVRHAIPNQGVLLFADAFSLLTGFYLFAKNKIGKHQAFILLWLLASPLPSVLSRDEIHAVRAFNMNVPLIMIAAFGLVSVVNKLRKANCFAQFTGYCLLVTVYLASFLYFFDAYFVHLPIHNAKAWNYGYKEVVAFVTGVQRDYSSIKIQQSYAQPYIYFLFYQKYDPTDYWIQANLTESGQGDVGLVEHLDNIYFSPVNWSGDIRTKNLLLGGDSIQIDDQKLADPRVSLEKEIYYPSGEVAFRVVKIIND